MHISLCWPRTSRMSGPRVDIAEARMRRHRCAALHVIPERRMSSPLRSGATPANLGHRWSERVRHGDAAAYEAVFRAILKPVVAYVTVAVR
jgi:hypothetical protein